LDRQRLHAFIADDGILLALDGGNDRLHLLVRRVRQLAHQHIVLQDVAHVHGSSLFAIGRTVQKRHLRTRANISV